MLAELTHWVDRYPANLGYRDIISAFHVKLDYHSAFYGRFRLRREVKRNRPADVDIWGGCAPTQGRVPGDPGAGTKKPTPFPGWVTCVSERGFGRLTRREEPCHGAVVAADVQPADQRRDVPGAA